MVFCVFSPRSGIVGSKYTSFFNLIDMSNNFRVFIQVNAITNIQRDFMSK